MPSLTEDLQTNLRLSTGTQNTFNGDLHAYLDSVGIAKGQLNERMIAYAVAKSYLSQTQLTQAQLNAMTA